MNEVLVVRTDISTVQHDNTDDVLCVGNKHRHQHSKTNNMNEVLVVTANTDIITTQHDNTDDVSGGVSKHRHHHSKKTT